MHKGIILLTKASDKDEALSEIEVFLESYGEGDVWDWYVIGGRWSGTLNPKTREFYAIASKHFEKTHPENNPSFITKNMVTEQEEALNEIWSSIGGTGLNPYARDNYDRLGADDDVIPLNDCIDVVNEWHKDLNDIADINWNSMVKAKEEKDNGMSAYYANRYAEAVYDEFCFESNVYDIQNLTNDPTKALESVGEYFAVMVDMHN